MKKAEKAAAGGATLTQIEAGKRAGTRENVIAFEEILAKGKGVKRHSGEGRGKQSCWATREEM